MARIAMIFGVLLVALGLGGHYGSDQAGWSAWIAALFGSGLLGLGVAALKESFRKHAMHAAAVLGLVGFLVTIHGLVEFLRLVSAKPDLLTKSTTAILCGTFLVLAIKSFVDARRRRPRSETTADAPAEPVEPKA